MVARFYGVRLSLDGLRYLAHVTAAGASMLALKEAAGAVGFECRAVQADFDRLRRSEEHTSELQSRQYLVCRLLLEKKTTSTPQPPLRGPAGPVASPAPPRTPPARALPPFPPPLIRSLLLRVPYAVQTQDCSLPSSC